MTLTSWFLHFLTNSVILMGDSERSSKNPLDAPLEEGRNKSSVS